jgi:hypothetical protein
MTHLGDADRELDLRRRVEAGADDLTVDDLRDALGDAIRLIVAQERRITELEARVLGEAVDDA